MTEPLTRSERILAEKTVCILLVRGIDPDGKPIFAYVAIRADRLQDFMAAQESGMFYPEEYGTIIEAGEGEPSEEIQQRMRDEFGFNHDSMLELAGSEDETEKNMQRLREMQREEAERQGFGVPKTQIDEE